MYQKQMWLNLTKNVFEENEISKTESLGSAIKEKKVKNKNYKNADFCWRLSCISFLF